MATLFIDYEQLVLQAYEQKKINNTLPHGLKHLTPAKLKDECVMRCEKGVSKRDEKAIRDFCGDLNESKTALAIIQRCETDKFRPLVNFLKKKSESTDPKNIELLAFLIDFPGRPWEIGKTYSGSINDDIDEGVVRGGVVGGITNAPDNPVKNPIIPEIPAGGGHSNVETKMLEANGQDKVKGKSTKRLTAAVVLSLVLGTGGIWWWKDKNHPSHVNGGCMYWMEDHYEPIACNQKIPNTLIIALDTVKLKNFRKITIPDTITYQAKGKVWYSKIDGKIEFYTSGGMHPVNFGHRLKPITDYMIDKYIRSGVVTK
ncbi:hypothetical protein [Chitinophaga sp.]|uniref:hypothetical protein n=1 Tax=Chitinophaga sp. TaxID=1869181 RepID=UPI0031D52B84